MKRRSPLIIVFFTIFLDLVGFGIVMPLSPFYAEHFGASAFEVGLLQAVYSLMQFFFAPIWGRLSDRVGRRPIILMSLAGGAISYFVFAGAETLWILFASRIFQGIFAANVSATQAYIADSTDEKDRAKGMGIVGAAFGLGFVFGPALGWKLSEIGPDISTYFGHHPSGIFGMGFPALVAGVLLTLNFLFAVVKLPESLTEESRKKASATKENRVTLIFKYLRRPELAWVIGAFFLYNFGMGNMEATLALLTQKRLGFDIAKTGELLAFVGVVMAFTQGYLIRKFAPKFGERKLIVAGPLIAALGLIVTTFAFSMSITYIAMAILALGAGITSPSVLSGISLVAGKDEQGGIMGVNQSLGSLARFLGPACGGFLFGTLGPASPYYVGALAMLAVVVLSLINAKKLPDVRDRKFMHG